MNPVNESEKDEQSKKDDASAELPKLRLNKEAVRILTVRSSVRTGAGCGTRTRW